MNKMIFIKKLKTLLFTLLAAITCNTGIAIKASEPPFETLSENTETVVLIQPDQKVLDDNILAQEQLDTQPLVENIPQESSWDRKKKMLINAARITKNIAIDVGVACAITTTSILVHELGHAITAKLLFGCPVDITLGSLPNENTKPFLTISGVKLTGLGLKGYARADVPETCNPSIVAKKAIISLAGPLAGSCYSYAIHKALSSARRSLPCSFLANYLMAFGNLEALFPVTVSCVTNTGEIKKISSDGSKFIKCITWLIKHHRGQDSSLEF